MNLLSAVLPRVLCAFIPELPMRCVFWSRSVSGMPRESKTEGSTAQTRVSGNASVLTFAPSLERILRPPPVPTIPISDERVIDGVELLAHPAIAISVSTEAKRIEPPSESAMVGVQATTICVGKRRVQTAGRAFGVRRTPCGPADVCIQ